MFAFVSGRQVIEARFPPPQTGVSLGPLGQLENKGMTGLSCSYNDATLAIITAHFASDSHGRNKLAKRNAVCRRVLINVLC